MNVKKNVLPIVLYVCMKILSTTIMFVCIPLFVWYNINKLVENLFVNRKIYISIQNICSLTHGLWSCFIRSLHGLNVRVGTRKTGFFIHCKFRPVSILFIAYFESYMLMLCRSWLKAK